MITLLGKLAARCRQNLPFLIADRHLSLRERARIAFARDRDVVAAAYIQKRFLKRHADGESIDIDGFRIFFATDYEVSNLDTLRLGAGQVVAETFLFPAYFSRNARIKPGDVVFDLGANIGTTSLIFSRLAGSHGSVHAFEPVMHPTLRKNLDANGAANVVLNPVGVSDKRGTAEIEMSDFGLDSSICHREYTAGYYSVRKTIELVDLDSYCREHAIARVDFIKMDIEGAEELALTGAREVIEKYRPVWVISSYHTDFQNEAQHPKLLKILREHGYRIEEEPFKRIVAY